MSFPPGTLRFSVLLFALLWMLLPCLHADSPPSSALDVQAHGAKGDGVTDDTAAIKAVVAKAAAEGASVVYFPKGEYLLSQGIYLHANLKLTGAPGAVLKTVPAVTQRFLRPVAKGATMVTVEDASAYTVGHDCYLWDGVGSTYEGTVGTITAIDPRSNTITFEGRKSEGARKAYLANEKSVFSTSFSMLTTSRQGEPIENLTIEGLTFDPQPQPGEPLSYPLSPIHIDPRPNKAQQQHVVIRGNTILRSAADGISVQGCDNATIEDNRVYNCAGHGIHVGFTIARIVVRNNHIENCGDCAVFWCYGVVDMVVTHNFIKNNRIGCGGIDADGYNSVIAFNAFDGNEVGVNMTGNGKGRTLVNGNFFSNGRGNDVDIYVSSASTISGNMFSGGKGVGISVRGTQRVNIVDNQFVDHTGEYAIRLWRQPGGPQRRSEQIRIAGNFITGGTRACLLAEDSSRVILSENDFAPAEGAKAIEIAASCTDFVLRDNQTEGDVINLSASQP